MFGYEWHDGVAPDAIAIGREVQAIDAQLIAQKAVPGPHVGEIGSDDEHLAGEAEGEVRLVLEGDTEEERSVLDGMVMKSTTLP